ncbi:lmo0937 family membrane protein [Leptolyngbya sp. FACHB-17]
MFVLLFIFWIAGFALHIAGGLIDLLLVLAISIAIYNFAMSRDARQ